MNDIKQSQAIEVVWRSPGAVHAHWQSGFNLRYTILIIDATNQEDAL